MTKESKYDILTSIEIPDSTGENWTKILDLIAKIMNVPVALIMRVRESEIEVFAKSLNPENIYEEGETAELNTGLYCETVMDTRKELLVPNALKDPKWSKNPDIELGMISYLGMPLLWPTGQIFGTICVLDKVENPYSDLYRELLEKFRDAVQINLENIYSQELLEQEIAERKRAEEDRDRLIGELRKALSEVKRLSGLLPICSNCKKIRDDEGYWRQIEQYIGERSEAEFTHGFCPDCAAKLYPGRSKERS
jgi:GAF domain-containing protein